MTEEQALAYAKGFIDKCAQAGVAPQEVDSSDRLSAYLHQLLPGYGPAIYGASTKPKEESGLWEAIKSMVATPVGQAAGGIGGAITGKALAGGRGALPGALLGALVGGGEALHATRGD